MFDLWPLIIQLRAWRNLHGFEPGSDILSKLRDLIGPVRQRRGARGQQCLLLWEMQGEGQYCSACFYSATLIPCVLTMCTCVHLHREPQWRGHVSNPCPAFSVFTSCASGSTGKVDAPSNMMNRLGYEAFLILTSQISILGYTVWFCYNTSNINLIYKNSVLLVHSSPGCWTWSPTPCLEWLVKTAAERAARGEAMGPQEDHPGRKSQSLRTMNSWESLSTAVRHMPDTTTPSLKTDGKR